MRKSAKLLAILLAVFLGTSILASIPVQAAPPDNGNLIIHKYVMNDLSLAKDPNDGTIITDPSKLPVIPDEAKPIEGIEFKVYKITVPTTSTENPNPDNAPWNQVLNNTFDNSTFSLDDYVNPTKITLNTASGVPAQTDFAISLQATQSTIADGTATFTALPKGFYVVVETVSNKVASVVFPFIVAIPMTNAAGDGWLADTHCYPKNGDITITKEVDRTAVAVGETANWTLVPSVPADIKTYKMYDIVDVLDYALTYNGTVNGTNNITSGLTVKGATSAAGPWTDIAAADYTATLTPVGAVPAPAHELRISFNATGRTDLATLGYKFIQVKFSTTTNKWILDYAASHEFYTVENDAKVEFKNKFHTEAEPYDRPSDEVEIHSGAIILEKRKAHENTPLIGAEFQIARTEAEAKAGTFIKKDADGKLVYFGDTGYAALPAWIETSTMSTDPRFANPRFSAYAGKAIVLFEGLKMFNGLKDDAALPPTPQAGDYLDYWIVETKAPTGYNLLIEPIHISFDGSTTEASWWTEGDTIVKNTNTFTLPRTGGMGTVLFTAGGVALIGIAAFLLVLAAKKRKAKNAA